MKCRRWHAGGRLLEPKVECVDYCSIFHPLSLSSFSIPLLSPFGHERLRQAQVVEYTRDDGVHHLLNRLWVRVERGIGRKNRCAREQQQFEVFQMYQV